MNSDIEFERSKFQQFNYNAAFFCAICFMFFIPSATTLMNVFIFLTFIFFSLSGNIKKQWIIIWSNPVAKNGLKLFGLLLLGITWSIADIAASLEILKKYNELWYIAFLIPIFDTPQRREIGINVFLISMGITLVGVYLLYFEFMPTLEWTIMGKAQRFNVDHGFSSHIITNILMSFAMFIAAHKSMFKKDYSKWLYILIFLFSFYYVLFISTGTTGQIIAIALLCLLIIQHLRGKAILFLPLLMIFISIITFNVENNSVQHAINKIMVRIDKSNPNYTASIDARPQLYVHALKTIIEDPWIGTGTGSYKEAIRTKQLDFFNQTDHSKNPHNEYILMSVQLGIIGLLALLYLFFIQTTSTRKINNIEHKYIAQGLVLLMIIGCMFNSLILDSRNGHFWAFFSALLFSNLNEKRANAS